MRPGTAQKSYLGMIWKAQQHERLRHGNSRCTEHHSPPEVLARSLGPGVLGRCLSIVFGLCVLRLVLAAPEQFGHLHEIGQRTRAHFPHDMATMDLDGDLADPQVARDLLVHQSRRD